ncbi:MAG: hypothetical protein AAFW00_09840 [Bacteroidota bacterium]
MKNWKVWQYLSLLSAEEKKQIPEWMRLILGIQQQHSQKLCLFLLQQPEAPTQETAWKYLYPDQPFRPVRLRHLSEKVTQLLTQYLQWRQFQRRTSLQDECLLAELHHRHASELFKLAQRKQARQIPDPTAWDHEVSRAQYQKAWIIESHYENHQPQASNLSHLVELYAHDQLWEYVWLQIALANAARKRQKVSSKALDHIDPADWERQARAMQSSLMDLHLDILSVLRGTHVLDDALIEGFWMQQDAMSPATAAQLTKVLVNLLRQNYGQTRDPLIGRQWANFMQRGIESQHLLEEGQLSPVLLKNLVTILLILDDAETARAVVTNYLSLVPAEEQEDVGIFNHANIDFHTGAYGEVIRSLRERRYGFSDIFYTLNARMLFLQAHYEQGEGNREESYDWFLGEIHNFRRFVRAQKSIAAPHKERYKRFLSGLRSLLRTENHTQLQELHDQLLEQRQVSGLSWLLQKIKEKQ